MCCSTKPPVNTVTSQHLIRAAGVSAAAAVGVVQHPGEALIGAALGMGTGLLQAGRAWWQGRSIEQQSSCSGAACASGLTQVLTGGLPMSESERRVRTAVLMAIYYRCMSTELFAFSACLDFPRAWGVQLGCRLRNEEVPKCEVLSFSSWGAIISTTARIAVMVLALRERRQIAIAGLICGLVAGVLSKPAVCSSRAGCSNGFSRFMSNGIPISDPEATLRSSLLAASHITCSHLGRVFAPVTSFEFFSPIGRACYQVTQGKRDVDWQLDADARSLSALALLALAAYRHRRLTLLGALVGIAWGAFQEAYNPSPAKPSLDVPGGCMRDFSQILQRGRPKCSGAEAEAKNSLALVAHSSKMPAFAAYCSFDLARAMVLRPVLGR